MSDRHEALAEVVAKLVDERVSTYLVRVQQAAKDRGSPLTYGQQQTMFHEALETFGSLRDSVVAAVVTWNADRELGAGAEFDAWRSEDAA